jgi:hypothetical protein
MKVAHGSSEAAQPKLRSRKGSAAAPTGNPSGKERTCIAVRVKAPIARSRSVTPVLSYALTYIASTKSEPSMAAVV